MPYCFDHGQTYRRNEKNGEVWYSHKINNPLTTLLGRAQMLKLLDHGPQVAKTADMIEESSKRIAAYIGELALVVKEGREESLDRLLDTERPEV